MSVKLPLKKTAVKKKVSQVQIPILEEKLKELVLMLNLMPEQSTAQKKKILLQLKPLLELQKS